MCTPRLYMQGAQLAGQAMQMPGPQQSPVRPKVKAPQEQTKTILTQPQAVLADASVMSKY